MPAVGSVYPSGTRLAAYLTDFGAGKFTVAAILKTHAAATGPLGTIPYMAPVCVDSTPSFDSDTNSFIQEAFFSVNGPETDIFSLGCVMYEVCELRLAYTNAQRTHSPVVAGPYHEYIKTAIHACLILKKEKRPSLAELDEYLRLLSAAVKQPAKPARARVANPNVARQPVPAANLPVAPKPAPQGRVQPIPAYNPRVAYAPVQAAPVQKGGPSAGGASTCIGCCGLLCCCGASALCCTVM